MGKLNDWLDRILPTLPGNRKKEEEEKNRQQTTTPAQPRTPNTPAAAGPNNTGSGRTPSYGGTFTGGGEQRQQQNTGTGGLWNPLADVAEENAQRSTSFSDDAKKQTAKKEEQKPEEKKPELKTSKEREEALKKYNELADRYDELSGYAADDLSAKQNENLRREMEAAKADLDAIDEELGNGVQDYRDSERGKDMVGSWAKGRAAGLGSALGTGLEWLGEHSFDLAGSFIRPSIGEEAYRQMETADRNGTFDSDLEDMGGKLFEASQNLQGEADKQWETGTAGMSDNAKFIANIAKTGADVAMDALDNAIVPGMGTMRMYMGAAGSGALEQAGREMDDVDSRAAKALTSGVAAWFSTKLTGGMESVYGKSVLGNLTGGLYDKISNPVLKTAVKALTNTEGVEEGLEDLLGYAADQVLNLNPGGQLDWDEVKTDALVGYVLGVITNGIAGGINYTATDLHNIADEGIEFAQRAAAEGLTMEQAAREALSNEEEQPVIRAGRNTEAQQETNPQQDAVEQLLNKGGITDREAAQVRNDPALRRAFTEATGIELDGMGEKAQAQAIKDAVRNKAETEQRDARGAVMDMYGQAARPDFESTSPEYGRAQEIRSLLDQETEPTRAEVDRIVRDMAYREALGAEIGRDLKYARFDEVRNAIAEARAQRAAAEPETESVAPVRQMIPETPAEAQNPAPAQNRAETPQNETTVPGGINSQAETQNADVEGLTNTESEAGQTETAQTNPNGVAGPNIPLADLTPRARKEKVSQYFLNTLTESGRAKGLDPVTYKPTSEAESLANAAMRLNENEMKVLDDLMMSAAWNGELVDAAWMIENNLYLDFIKSGNDGPLNAWKQIETHKISETAKGLQAVAKQSRPGASAVLNASMNLLNDIRNGTEPGTEGVTDAEIKEASEQVNEAARELGQIELEIRDKTDAGMDEEEARSSVKEKYLDLAEKINRQRNVGLFQDGNPKAEKANSKFRRMLGNQDMDFIQRFVACQASGIAEDLKYKGKQDTLKRLNTFQKLAQLTGTGTWMRNLEGNGSFGIIDLLSNNNPVTLIADQIMKGRTGQRSTGVEFGILDRNVLKQAHQAMERSILEVASNIDLADSTEMEKYDLSRRRTFDPDGSMASRFLSRWEQWNGYMLNSSDKLFRGGTEQSVENAIIRANGWDAENLTAQQRAQLDEAKRQVADYRLFQNRGQAAEAADKLRDGLNKLFNPRWEKGQFGVGTALMPYTTVPTNLGVKALEFSPAGAVKGLAEMIRLGPEATLAQQNKAVTDFGRGITGTALIAGLARLMRNMPFFKDWENEDDLDVKAQNKAEGKSGMQFNIDMFLRGQDGDTDTHWRTGDRTIDISAIEPLNQLLTTASLIAEGEEFGNALVESATQNLMALPSMSALSNIENTIKYTDTPEDAWQTAVNTAASTAGSVVSGFIPAPVRHIATATDDKTRDTSGNNAVERAVNQVKSALPGARQTLAVKTDNYGNEIGSGSLNTRIANTYGANKFSEVNQTDVSREVERVREATGEDYTPDRNGPRSENFGSGRDREKVTLTTEERRAFKETVGEEYTDAVDTLLNSSLYRNATDIDKADILSEALSMAKEAAKAEVAKEHDQTYKGNYDAIRDLKSPAEYLAVKTRFKNAQEDEDYDGIDALIQASKNMPAADREVLLDKNDKLKHYANYAEEGVSSSKVVAQYDEGTKVRREARGSTQTSGADILAEIAAGNYSPEDADVFMMHQQSDGDYAAGKGRATVYKAMRDQGYSPDVAIRFWEMTQTGDEKNSGTLTKKEFNAALSAIPEPWRSKVKEAVYAAYPTW